jgi:hypothetical protein
VSGFDACWCVSQAGTAATPARGCACGLALHRQLDGAAPGEQAAGTDSVLLHRALTAREGCVPCRCGSAGLSLTALPSHPLQLALLAVADLALHLNGCDLELSTLRLLPSSSDHALQGVGNEGLSAALSDQPAHGGASPRGRLCCTPFTPTHEVLSALWAVHSPLPHGALAAGRELLPRLASLAEQPAALHAYPCAQVGGGARAMAQCVLLPLCASLAS